MSPKSDHAKEKQRIKTSSLNVGSKQATKLNHRGETIGANIQSATTIAQDGLH